MPEHTLHIKNMVCRRCVMTVEDICRELGLKDARVELGSITLSDSPDQSTLDNLYGRLRDVGFEPLKSPELTTVERIKRAIRHYARHNHDDGKIKLSGYLEDAVKLDFRHLSRLFSSIEGRTIQSYLMSQRMEYVKELLFDNELSLAQIADVAGFSSVAHLSRAFKKSQGMTISEFKDSGQRTGIDEV